MLQLAAYGAVDAADELDHKNLHKYSIDKPKTRDATKLQA
jgi:hypothetical protein